MTDKPILCTPSVARAIWEGRQTQDRRPITPRAPPSLFDGTWADSYVLDPGNADWRNQDVRYRVGDRLWVREAHAVVGTCDPGWVLYCASGYEAECERYGFDAPPPESGVRWKPSFLMPRWASRMTLLVTDVRVQRVQEIPCADAIAEGVRPAANSQTIDCATPNPREEFASLWDSLYAKRPGLSWAENPWVAATTFTTVRQNIDQMEG